MGYPIHIEHCYAAQWVDLTEGVKELDIVFDTLPPGDCALQLHPNFEEVQRYYNWKLKHTKWPRSWLSELDKLRR